MTLNTLERARLELQARLDAGKSAAERNRLGQFATPPDLANEVVTLALSALGDDVAVRFLDPAFGTGSFFSALLPLVHRGRLTAAAGFEIDPHYGEPARSLWGGVPLDLRLGDFTRQVPTTDPTRRANLLICNPPYVRHHHLSREQKERLQRLTWERTGLKLSGLSGLYCYFLLLSAAHLSPGGVGAWLIPSEFMDVNYGAQVKRFLLEQVTLLRLHRFESAELQFDDALVSSAVLLLKNERPPADHRVQLSTGALSHPAHSAFVAAADLERATKWTAFPQSGDFASDKGRGPTLSDFFHIKRGLATGCNDFFVLSADRVRDLGIPDKYLRPILPSPRHLSCDEVEADREGNPLLSDVRYLLDTKAPEKDIRRDSPELWRYLESGKAQGVHERFLCSRRSPWYSQENRPPAPFLCTYMGRATQRTDAPFRFILNRSQATAANVYLLMYPKPPLARHLSRHPEAVTAVWEELKAVTSATMKSEGRTYGGGLHKMEPNELGQVSADRLCKLLPNLGQFNPQPTLFD